MMELPPDKLVVVRIFIRRDETASPICVDAKSFKVRHTKGREVL